MAKSRSQPTRRVLVTGASGFVGRHTLPALLARGFEVHAVSSRPPSEHAASPPPCGHAEAEGVEGLTWHLADLLDPGARTELVELVAPSHLLHLAWYAEPGAFWTAPVNVRWLEASLGLLREFAAAGGKRVVAAGTCAEYDWSTATICREADTPLGPHTLYGECKRSLSAVAERLYAAPEMPSLAWGRIFFLYGPFEHPKRLLPSVAQALLTGREALCTDGRQQRDFMHCADAAEAFAALLDCEVQGPVNIASGDALSVAELVTVTAEECGHPELVRLGALPARADDPSTLVADSRRLREEVGFTSARTLRQGISETVEWWREQLAR